MATVTHKVNYDIAAQDRATQAFNSIHRAMGQVEQAGTRLRNILGGLGLGITIGSFVSQLVRETKEAEQASARLSAVIKATGNAADITRQELDEMAESMQSAFGFDDEDVRNAEAQLMKFGNIHGQIFRDALKVTADLAAFMGTSMAEAAQMVGKSLQSPTEALRAYEAQFGKLAPEQEKFINDLARQGRAVEAQREILKLYQGAIGGTAELMNTGLTRATRDIANAWNDFLEELGQTQGPMRIVREALEGLAVLIREISGWMRGPSAGVNSLREMAKQLEANNKELDELRAKQRQLSGSIVRPGDDRAAEFQRIRDRIVAIQEESRAIVERHQTLSKAYAEQAAQEEALAGATLKRTQLGGDPKADEEARRRLREAEELRRKFAEIQAKAAPEPLDARYDELTKFWSGIALDAKGTAEEIRRTEEAQKKLLEAELRFLELQARMAPQPLDVRYDELEKFWAQQAIAVEKVDDLTQDLGFTFQSAFEDAVIGGEKLREVIQGIGQDIARIILRRTVTEPLAAGVSSWAAGLFNSGGAGSAGALAGAGIGGRQHGGPAMAGRAYLVGERGPELFVPGSSGAVVPNGGFGGVTINNGDVIVSGGGVTASEVRMALEANSRRTIAAVRELQRR